ncbi:peptidoglycan/xylan/chitin deacetylase (PgdA/CDA1 family) [Geodermatophilus bullaregiensis]|uniref:polysaccharide deacetylase family protein n=1 Tax=Geodermatophilus bullaregiensis TaxID=1564160 RepID=UPI00195BFCEC|nr:polysaccharide deacetylase family protein [Geodermatophilus bullaregiensis]MBM7804166.1 peptidoglycan/xylan/chitin deacetylase (PgdA/CDA1 family) [Geodermatophilus bullaregiensis]
MAVRSSRLRWRAEDSVAQVHRRAPEGSVALTFDDGPHPGSTDRILEVLSELDVRATFFCVGRNARAHPHLVRGIRAEGHAVGSHSLTHPHPRETAPQDLRAEYQQGRGAVAEALGADTPLFRPPHGHLGPVGAVVIRRLGLTTWLWTVDPRDWRPGATVDEIVSVAARAVSGDVVLLHDWVEQAVAPEALDRSATVAALPLIVRAIRERGLRLEALDA